MRFNLSCFLFLFTLSVSAQQRIASLNLKKIFDQLPQECKKRVIDEQECDCMIGGKVFHLTSVIDEDEITQLGLKVFDDSIHKYNNDEVFSFIEREFLIFILDDFYAREKQSRENKVYFYYRGIFQDSILMNSPNQVQEVISNIVDISMMYDSIKYVVLFTNSEGARLRMEFPAHNELISGMDKKELEDHIFAELTDNNKNRTTIKQSKQDCSFNNYGDLLVCEGNRFFIQDFNSSTYYCKVDGIIRLVYDRKYVTETFSNLFLSELSSDHPISINLKMMSYGNNEKFTSITVDKFLSHFDNQFRLFFGIEDTSDNHLRGTLILYNPALNYLHLLDIKTDVESLFGNPGYVAGILYAFIPTHNIKNLLGRVGDTNSVLLDDVIDLNTY